MTSYIKLHCVISEMIRVLSIRCEWCHVSSGDLWLKAGFCVGGSFCVFLAFCCHLMWQQTFKVIGQCKLCIWTHRQIMKVHETERGGVFLHATSKNSPSKQTITSYKQGSYSHMWNAMHSLRPLYNTNRAFFWSGTGAAGSPYLLSGQDSLIRQTARRWLREMNICCLWIPSLCCADVTADYILDEVKSNQGVIPVVTKQLNTGSFRAQGFYRDVVVPWGVPGDYLNMNPGHFRNTCHSLKAWCKNMQKYANKNGQSVTLISLMRTVLPTPDRAGLKLWRTALNLTSPVLSETCWWSNSYFPLRPERFMFSVQRADWPTWTEAQEIEYWPEIVYFVFKWPWQSVQMSICGWHHFVLFWEELERYCQNRGTRNEIS